jgi:hypothetical protein
MAIRAAAAARGCGVEVTEEFPPAQVASEGGASDDDCRSGADALATVVATPGRVSHRPLRAIFELTCARHRSCEIYVSSVSRPSMMTALTAIIRKSDEVHRKQLLDRISGFGTH